MIKQEIVAEEVDVLSPIHQGSVNRTIDNSNRMVNTAAHNPDSNDNTFSRTALGTDNNNKTVNTTAHNSDKMANNNNRMNNIRTPNSNKIRIGSQMVNGSTEPNQTMDNAENITITRRMGWVKDVQ